MTNTPKPEPSYFYSTDWHGAQHLRAAAAALDAITDSGDRLTIPTGAWLRQRANALHPQSDPEGIQLAAEALDAGERDKPAIRAAAVVRTIAGVQFTFANEEQLQAGILDALEHAGIVAKREVVLSRNHGRVDLFVPDGVAVEVKTAGTWSAVYRQLERYTRAPEVRRLVLVTTKAEHTQKIPRQIGGVIVEMVLLRNGYGVIC